MKKSLNIVTGMLATRKWLVCSSHNRRHPNTRQGKQFLLDPNAFFCFQVDQGVATAQGQEPLAGAF